MKGKVNIQGNMPTVEFLLKFIVSYRSSHLIMSYNMNLVLNVNWFLFSFSELGNWFSDILLYFCIVLVIVVVNSFP